MVSFYYRHEDRFEISCGINFQSLSSSAEMAKINAQMKMFTDILPPTWGVTALWLHVESDLRPIDCVGVDTMGLQMKMKQVVSLEVGVCQYQLF